MYFSPDDRAKMLHAHCTPKDQGVPGQPSYLEVADLLEHHIILDTSMGLKNVI